MKIFMILADAAQEVNGKLFILGGGWDVAGSPIPAMSVAVKAEIPWTSTNKKLNWSLKLINEDGNSIADDAGNIVGTAGQIEVGRPPGHPEGAPISFPMALNINNLSLASGRYEWQLEIDDSTESVAFVIK
jgi:hypothetical protein